MKSKMKLITILGLFVVAAVSLQAADKAHLGGPKGGRLLEKTEPKAEFFLEKDHTATIMFYDTALKPVAATEQTVTVIANATGGKQTVEFEKKGDVLVSKSKLPEGDGYNLVLQFKQSPTAKPQNHRFKLETHTCGGCKRAEYGCTCDE